MTKICPICGYRNRDSAEYCEKCLFNLSEENELSMEAQDQEGLDTLEEGLGIYCPNGHWNPPDAKFCQVCGVPLGEEDTQEDLFLPQEDTGEKGRVMKVYKLLSHETEFVVELPVYEGKVKEMLIGRRSGKNVPDIDLTGVKGAERVSRKHATFILDGKSGDIFILDMGSTNGTFVNGKKLSPGEKMKLEKGDEIVLGKILKFVLEEV